MAAERISQVQTHHSARVWLALLLLQIVLLPGCVRRAESPRARIRATATPSKVSGRPRVPQFGPLTLLGAWQLSCKDPRFGGLSGLWIDHENATMVSISDRGHWISARVSLAPDGRLTAAREWRFRPLLGPDTTRVSADATDAEALTRDAKGRWLVAFEQQHRIWRYPANEPFGSPAEPLELAPSLAEAPPNGGLETLVTLADGALLAISERLLTRSGAAVRGWLRRDGTTVELDYAISELFLPTDAARLPNGNIIVLERRYLGRERLDVRLRMLEADTVEPGALLRSRHLARLSAPLPIDNFEGLAIVPHAAGPLIWIVSDDNFSAQQRTLLLQFRLDLAGAGRNQSPSHAVSSVDVETIDACPTR